MSVADMRPFAAKSSIIVRLVGSARASNNCWPGMWLPSRCRDKLLSGSLIKPPLNKSYERPPSMGIHRTLLSHPEFFRGKRLGSYETCVSRLNLAERISGLRVCEELNPSTALTDERVQMEDALSELRPVSKEQVSGPASSSGPEWNVAHVSHGSVAAWTFYNEASLRRRLGQHNHRGLALTGA